MNPARSAPSNRESALLVSYAFNVNIFSGLGEEQMGEVSNLLRIHADRSQLTRLRADIDAILQDESELEYRAPNQRVFKDIDRLLSPDSLIGGDTGISNAIPQSRGYGPGPSGSLDKLADQLQALLGRVSDRRRPPRSHAGVES